LRLESLQGHMVTIRFCILTAVTVCSGWAWEIGTGRRSWLFSSVWHIHCFIYTRILEEPEAHESSHQLQSTWSSRKCNRRSL